MAIEKAMEKDMQLDPKGLEAARTATEAVSMVHAEATVRAYLEAAPSPSSAPGVVTILNAAYAAGFEASGEGWNAEYPFADGNGDFEDDPDWASLRDKRIAPLLASLPQPAKGEREGGAFAEMLTALRQVEAEMRVGLGSSYGETREQVRRAIASAERCGNE